MDGKLPENEPPSARAELARSWLGLAVGALATSGLLSFGVVAARIPALAPLWTHTELAHRVLVVHVDLGVVVWFCAFPVMLVQLWAAASGRPQPGPLVRVAPRLSAAGALGLLAGLFPGLGSPHTVNYVPMVAHWWYASSLALFFGGVIVSHLDPILWRRCANAPAAVVRLGHGSALPPAVLATLVAAGTTLRLGALAVVLALANLAVAASRLPRDLDTEVYLEALMWGPGHLLQLANVAFVVVAWALLAAFAAGRGLVGRPVWILTAGAVALPLAVAVLLLVWRDPLWWGYRSGFITLMRWGLFPAISVLLVLGLVPAWRRAGPSRRDVVWSPLVASVLLMLVGFGFGALIEGSDLRIPGHYHACIGAVTLAFMALALVLPGTEGASPLGPPARRRRDQLVRAVAVLYGSGQLIFASGLMVAGSFGLGRKTYGVDQRLDHGAQQIGLLIMAIGGTLALLGGATWALGALRRWWLLRPR